MSTLIHDKLEVEFVKADRGVQTASRINRRRAFILPGYKGEPVVAGSTWLVELVGENRAKTVYFVKPITCIYAAGTGWRRRYLFPDQGSLRSIGEFAEKVGDVAFHLRRYGYINARDQAIGEEDPIEVLRILHKGYLNASAKWFFAASDIGMACGTATRGAREQKGNEFAARAGRVQNEIARMEASRNR